MEIAKVFSNGGSQAVRLPKGCRLPTQAEFNSLKSTYTTGATLTASPFLGIYGGYYNGSSDFYLGGFFGYYRSSTADSGYAYLLRLNSSYADVSSDSMRLGASIRCVAD